jgi:hypothetical protein
MSQSTIPNQSAGADWEALYHNEKQAREQAEEQLQNRITQSRSLCVPPVERTLLGTSTPWLLVVSLVTLSKFLLFL